MSPHKSSPPNYRRFATWVGLATMFLAGAMPVRAQIDPSGIQGGPDGDYFEHSCGEGRVLVGLRGNAGVWVDSVQAICARVDAASNLIEPQPSGRIFGGTGGSDQATGCPPGRAVSAAHPQRNETTPVIGKITFKCLEFRNPNGGGSNNLDYGGTGHLLSYSEPTIAGAKSHDIDLFSQFFSCPAGQFAVGIKGRSREFLNAFGIICGTPTAAKIDAGFANLVGQDASFQSANFLDRYIRHKQSLGFTDPIGDDLARQDSTFRIVEGLAGRCVSLESHNYPRHYLRHQGWRIKLSPREDSDLYKQDATFCMVPGLANSAGISFEAVAAPGHFIRHRNFELWVERLDGSDQFRSDATFLAAPPGGAALGVR